MTGVIVKSTKNRILQLYSQGVPIDEIYSVTGIMRHKIRALLQEAGVLK